jgi:predicted nucleic acid-binding protein
MIVLDTNVVSEALKPEPVPAVRGWLNEQAAETLNLSSVTVAELLFGIGTLPDGQRKRKLAASLDGLLGLFDGRILPFDTNAAHRHFDATRVRGEWFAMEPADILPILMRATSDGFVAKNADAFLIFGYDRDAVPEYLGV